MSTQPMYSFGGSGPVMHLAVANGFPPQTYTPLLSAFTTRYQVVSLPPRALWPGIDSPPEIVGSWHELSGDLLAGLRDYDLRGVIAIGHSFGAVASLRAVLGEPDRFHALILLDPVILPMPITDALKAARARGEVPRMPLVDGALKRRDHFADLDEAYSYWRGKPLFHDWSDEAVRLYAGSLTRPADDGEGLVLTWPREWEAYYYLSVDADVWDDLPRLRGLLPTLIIRAEHSDAYPKDSAGRVKTLLPEAAHVTLPGYGHLFPMAAPDSTRSIIEDWLAGL